MNRTEPILGQKLHPLNGCILVELLQSSKNFTVKEGKYDSRTEGIVLSVAPELLSKPELTNIIGMRIHFEEFKEGARIKRDGKIFSFIKFEDVRGYEFE